MSRPDCGPLRADLAAFRAHPGRRLPLVVSGCMASRELGGGMVVDGEVRLDGAAWTQMETLYVTGDIRATVVRSCRRCLRDVRTAIEICEEFDVPLLPSAEVVDLSPYVLGAIAAVTEPHVLCDPACRGLCPVCGADLNENPDHVCPHDDRTDRRRLGELLR